MRLAIAIVLVACSKDAPRAPEPTAVAPIAPMPSDAATAMTPDAANAGAIASSDPALDPWELEPAMLEQPELVKGADGSYAIAGMKLDVQTDVKPNGDLDYVVNVTNGAKRTSSTIEYRRNAVRFAEAAIEGEGFVLHPHGIVHTGTAHRIGDCLAKMIGAMDAFHIPHPTPLTSAQDSAGVVSYRANQWLVFCGMQSLRVWFGSARGQTRAVSADDPTKPAAHKPVPANLVPAFDEVSGPSVTLDEKGPAKTLAGVSLRYRDRDNNFAHPHYEIVATKGGKTETADVSTTGRDAEFVVFDKAFVATFPGNDVVVVNVPKTKVDCQKVVDDVVASAGISDAKPDEIVGFTIDAGFQLQYHSGWTLECGSATGRIYMHPTAAYKVIP